MGADDYITKPFGIMELISRVKAVLRRAGGTDEEKLIGIGQLFIDDEKRVAYVEDKPVELTYKEYELLKLLLHNAGIVVTLLTGESCLQEIISWTGYGVQIMKESQERWMSILRH